MTQEETEAYVKDFVEKAIKEYTRPLRKKIKALQKIVNSLEKKPIFIYDMQEEEPEDDMISKEEYDELIRESKTAELTGDYSKMIMLGDEKWKKINAYEQEYVCKHNHVTKSGYIETCSSCGKQW